MILISVLLSWIMWVALIGVFGLVVVPIAFLLVLSLFLFGRVAEKHGIYA